MRRFRGAAPQLVRIVIVILVVVTGLFVFVSVRAVPSIATNAQSANVNADLVNCRSEARIPYEQAAQRKDEMDAQAADTQSAAVVALLADDDALVAELSMRLASQRRAALDLAGVASREYDAYADRVQAAITDPDGFLADCHAAVHD